MNGSDGRHGPGRPRDERLTVRLHAAALELLQADGYPALTIDGVAKAAAVSRATVYRRWRSRADLAVDTLTRELGNDNAPDLGSVVEELRSVVDVLIDRLSTPPGPSLLAGIVAEAAADPELRAAFARDLVRPRRAAVEAVLARAVARGETPPITDMALVVDALVAPVVYRVLISGEPFEPEFGAKCVRLALCALDQTTGLRPSV